MQMIGYPTLSWVYLMNGVSSSVCRVTLTNPNWTPKNNYLITRYYSAYTGTAHERVLMQYQTDHVDMIDTVKGGCHVYG